MVYGVVLAYRFCGASFITLQGVGRHVCLSEERSDEESKAADVDGSRFLAPRADSE